VTGRRLLIARLLAPVLLPYRTDVNRLLLIERRRRPGDRKDYFRNKPNAWFEATKQQVALISRLRRLSERGLEVIDSGDLEVTRGLRDMRDMLTFYERELPKMFADWEKLRKE